MIAESLRAGIARAIITPPIGVDLTGYAGRTTSCTGVHDDLFAKALTLTDGTTKAAIVCLDLLGLNSEQILRIRQNASRHTGIPEDNILIATSHTHSGPATQLLRGCGTADENYLEQLLPLVAETIAKAWKRKRTVSFSHGTSEVSIAINRRLPTIEGSTRLENNPQGAIDKEVTIWRFAEENHKPMATLFNYACHAVVMDGNNLLVSADWPGSAARLIEAQTGGQAMFLQGCCGNVNPRERGTSEIAEKLGAEVATAVLNANLEESTHSRIEVISKIIHLPLQPPPAHEELERTAQQMQEALEKAGEETPLSQIHIYTAYRDWAAKLMSVDYQPADEIEVEIQRLSIGNAHIITLPGEAFVEYALQVKQMRPNVMVVGYANGNIGYIPTRTAFKEGGYEISDAYRLYGEQMLTPDVENLIIETCKQLLQ